MGDGTKIEWTDATWNPTRGCTPIAPGCKNCYATRQAIRQAGPGGNYHGLVRSSASGPKWTGIVRSAPEKVRMQPIRWRKPRMIFVDSMSDLFHEHLSWEEVDAIFAVMAICHGLGLGHTFQILTKRAARMRAYVATARITEIARKAGQMMEDGDGWHDTVAFQTPWPLPNVWLGVSVSDQATTDELVPELLMTPAAKRFISYEPALGPAKFGPWLSRKLGDNSPLIAHLGIDQIIVGGESGPRARPFDVAWARSVRDECREWKVACFIKQMGAFPVDGTCERCGGTGELAGGVRQTSGPPLPRYACPVCLGAKKEIVGLDDAHGGNMAEWPKDLRVREMP